MSNLETFTLIDLPYDMFAVSQGTNATHMRQMRDDSLSLLRGRTSLLRVASDYYDSYDNADDKTVMHYRDYLIAEAALASMRSTLFIDEEHNTLNSRADRILSEFNSDALWPTLVQRNLRNKPQYAGTLGSPAYYFLMMDKVDSPLQSLRALTRVIWSLVGANSEDSPSNRLYTLYQYMGDIQAISNTVISRMRAVLENDDITPEDELYPFYIDCRRKFIDIGDYTDLASSIFFGTWDRDLVNQTAFVLEDDEIERLSKLLRASNSILKPGGVPLLLQSLVVEGYANAAYELQRLEDEDAYSRLRDFLSSTDQRHYDIKRKVTSSLNLVAESYALLESLNLYGRSGYKKSLAYNNALSWLRSTGNSDIAQDSYLLSLRDYPTNYEYNNALSRTRSINDYDIEQDGLLPFLKQYLPNYVSKIPKLDESSSVLTDGTPYKYLQGLPPKGNGIYLTPRYTYGYDVARELQPTSNNPNLATISNNANLATIQVSEETVSSPFEAYIIYVGPRQTITVEEYEQMPSASNVVVAQPGPPSSDLSYVINLNLDIQNRVYEAVNTVHLTPSPRGMIGYEEMIRGMVSHLFRDSVSVEAEDKAKVDGIRAEHTSRVGGLLVQLKDTHLDSEVLLLKEWSDIVDVLI